MEKQFLSPQSWGMKLPPTPCLLDLDQSILPGPHGALFCLVGRAMLYTKIHRDLGYNWIIYHDKMFNSSVSVYINHAVLGDAIIILLLQLKQHKKDKLSFITKFLSVSSPFFLHCMHFSFFIIKEYNICLFRYSGLHLIQTIYDTICYCE